jgi:mRNA interferase MazF
MTSPLRATDTVDTGLVCRGLEKVNCEALLVNLLVDFGETEGSKARGVYPGVVVQHDAFNKSKINTIVVCLLTTTLKRANAPGNVLLLENEGGLLEDSVANVSLITHVNKNDLLGKMGTLRPDRVREILDGISILLEGP